MKSCCEKWERAASRHENLEKSLREEKGRIIHGFQVKECPACGEYVGKRLEEFIAEGCWNSDCDYQPKISFDT